MKETTIACDGILVAPVGPDGVWRAFRDLREAMRGMRQRDRITTSFVDAFAESGRPAGASDDAVLLVAGYRRDS